MEINVVKRAVIPKQPGSQYTDQQRRAVIADYAATGNISKTAKTNNLPRTTVTGWVRSDWGKEMAVEIRHSDEQASDTNLTKLNGNTMGTDISVDKGSKYTNQQRREAVIEYGIHGNMTKVAEVTGIPDATLSNWKRHTDWWDTMLGEVRNEINDRILPQNLKIAEKANERILDSLRNGDEKLVWDKAKNDYVIKRVKPTGKDASVMGGIAQDKARVQMNLPTSITDNRSTEEAIKALAKVFTDLSDKHKAEQLNEKQASAIPGEYKKIEEDQEK
ncbi:MAG: hypothetical protein IIA05_00045 [Proteobacteria bacterium]|nr:hypothetical protein [Pseudomonadota bacterium]